ncbi:hypothetical protein J6590_083591 [Homalodisca vitripennis]|nr:hypothetical protein J6590_083591 [Homalodisca vitripennis]
MELHVYITEDIVQTQSNEGIVPGEEAPTEKGCFSAGLWGLRYTQFSRKSLKSIFPEAVKFTSHNDKVKSRNMGRINREMEVLRQHIWQPTGIEELAIRGETVT